LRLETPHHAHINTMSPHTSALNIVDNDNSKAHDTTIIELMRTCGQDNLDEKYIRNVFYTLYATSKQIGKGGFGVIFSGHRIKDNLPIAIKVIKKAKITQWFVLDGQRIPLEIALMLRVSNVKNCIKILDYMEQRNCFVIVMERIETCKDLFDYITECGDKLDEIRVKSYFRQIVQTVCDCYKLGVFHRDIKDENILIDMNSSQLKLIDFGAGTFFTNKNCLFTDFQGTWKTRQTKKDTNTSSMFQSHSVCI
jgi:serine/threonine protein kinase